MKRINDILSYLLLLLLLMVTACSDEGREVASINQQMQESDLVELSIRTQVPEMEVGSRAATEKISAITAFAFSDESILIKKVDALLSNPTDTTGTLKIKVPKRTRSIHFVAKNGDSYDAGNYTLGTTTLQDLLVDKTTTDLHYWGMLTFADENALKASNLSLTLYRNMAKVVLTSKVDEENDYIAGFLNYNGNATLIPRDNSGNLGYQANAVTLPDYKGVASHDSPQQGLGTECFLSEHANDESNRLYAICYIGGKYYKIAFSNSNGMFFPLVRNHLYRIVINQISGGSDSYETAKDADPINGNVREETLNVTNVSLTSYKGKTAEVTVNIPDGITSLRVTSLPEQFDISASNDVTVNEGVYNVSGKASVNFTLTLKDTYIGTTGTPNISFSGSGPSVSATGTGTVTLNGFMDMYEMYGDISNLNGSQEYSDFFHTRNNTNVSNQSLTTEYVDAGANNSTLAHNHNTAAINMQNESSITFTIADTRYLTLLVAKSSDAPSINLQKDGQTWTKTSEATTLPDNYNFAKEGDITTSGRLIRYTLEPGTYTLQRGNNDYLLYYMRVTKDKPIMTDIAQPLITDYELAWSGGEFQDDKAKGYLKTDETNSKHIVNEDKLTHTVTLKSDGNSLNTKLNLNLTTFTLNKIDLNVATTRITFQSTNENNFNKKDTTQYITAQTNSCNIPKYNAGTYTLTATIGNPKYKYEIFYDSLKLKSVEYEVKSPIMPALYNSMDGSKLTPVNEFKSQDEAWAIGFKMPMVVPADPSSLIDNYEAYTIDINIPDWSMSDDISSGLGVIEKNDENYTLGTQNDSKGNEMIHPREGWTYKIALASIAGDSIVPSLENGNKGSDTDHYFTYGGTIAKEVSIPTPYEGVSNSLAVTLNFSYDVDGNYNFTNSTSLTNLKLNTSRVRLTATISSDDAQAFKGKTIYLKGVYPSINGANGGYAIHWVNSRQNNSTINYSSPDFNGLGLEFNIDSNNPQTTYFIEWIFKNSTNNYNGGEIGFTYTISSNDYNVIGETTATIAFTNEPTLIFNKNFEDSQIINGWGESNDTNGQNYNVSRSIGTDNNGNKYLIIENKNGGFAQAAVDAKEVDLENNYQPGNYTVSFKVKGQNNSGIIKEIVFQNTSNNYQIVSTNKTSIEYTTEWQTIVFDITINNSGDRFLIDYSDNTSVIFIDDLKLFKNN